MKWGSSMTKEEIIGSVMNFRPAILTLEEIENLSDQELIDIYCVNRALDYCGLLIKQQMISVILYMAGPAYKKLELLTMDTAKVLNIYLRTRNITQPQFEQEINSAIEELKLQAIEESDDATIALSREEAIVATGVIIPEPLLSFEEIENQSLLKRIHEITQEIAELEEDNKLTEALIRNCQNYMARNDYLNDISYNTTKINVLRDELYKLTRGRKVDDSGTRK